MENQGLGASPSQGGRRDALFFVSLLLSWALNAAFLKWPTAWMAVAAVACVGAGLYAGRCRPLLLKGVLVAALAFPLWSQFRSGTPGGREDSSAIRTLVTSEELILTLTPKLGELAKGLLNLQLPDAPRRELFAPEFRANDLLTGGGAGNGGDWGVQDKGAALDAATARLWWPLLADVHFFEHAKFYLSSGHFIEGDPYRFVGNVGFSAVAKMRHGVWCGLSAKQRVTWQNLAGGEAEADWRIIDWHTGDFSSVASEQLWFQESLEEALPRARDVVALRRSQHHEETVTFYLEGRKRLPHRYFSPISANQKPGIAVADIDGDGDDDVYVTVRRGHNKLLENQGDGTFLETADLHGLNVKNHSTCALFADFDNDGDADLMLGRSLLPCKYFENNGGWFSEVTTMELPRLAISMSASDYNGDGLLDVYLCTYRPAVLGGSSPAGGVAAGSSDWPDEFLSPEVAKEYYRRHAEANPKDTGNLFPNLLDQIGPPNVLLTNRGGGRFEPAAEGAPLGVWRNSLQATWCDYDGDGDPDLYVANDWAADHLFRNEGGGEFSDVSSEAGTTAFGFAMGASWGDYDNDGRHDLYVSNMFSKAGKRITAQVEGLNADYAESATGNYLYHQEQGGQFALVSGLEPPAMLVAQSGWAWGGQFADFNNDGWLDIYAVDGYFTAPREVATEVDL